MPNLDPEEWTALATSFQALIVAIAALVAVFQVREARKLREDQARPFIVVDFDLSDPPLIHITIANTGATMARSVRIQVEPPLESSLDKKGRPEPMAKLSVFTEEIPSMAPGKVIRLLFDSFLERERAKEKGTDLEDAYKVTVRYRGERGLLRRRSHKDTMSLDLGVYRNIQYVDRRTVHDLYGQVKTIADAVRRLSPTGSGVLVVSRKDQREDHARTVRRFRARPDASFAPRESSEPRARWELRRLRQRLGRALAVLSDRVDPEP